VLECQLFGLSVLALDGLDLSTDYDASIRLRPQSMGGCGRLPISCVFFSIVHFHADCSLRLCRGRILQRRTSRGRCGPVQLGTNLVVIFILIFILGIIFLHRFTIFTYGVEKIYESCCTVAVEILHKVLPH
jgi:hypothetical protein